MKRRSPVIPMKRLPRAKAGAGIRDFDAAWREGGRGGAFSPDLMSGRVW